MNLENEPTKTGGWQEGTDELEVAWKLLGSACQQPKTHATNQQWMQDEMHVSEIHF